MAQYSLAPLTVGREWSHGGKGFPIPDSNHPAARTVLEYMAGDIAAIRSGLAIATANATDLASSEALANAIKTALNAVSAQAPLVTFTATPAGAQW
jgi:hypothetical protein